MSVCIKEITSIGIGMKSLYETITSVFTSVYLYRFLPAHKESGIIVCEVTTKCVVYVIMY